jgi:hypothetical protein
MKFRKDKEVSRRKLPRKLPKELAVPQGEVLSVNQITQVEVYRGLCGETLK